MAPSAFPRNENDFYPTPAMPALGLVPHLAEGTRFVEPCAGDGALARHLVWAGECAGKDIRPVLLCDAYPRAEGVIRRRAERMRVPRGAVVITNPPWSRDILLAILSNLHKQATTWLLLPLNFSANEQSAWYMRRCRTIQALPRIKWVVGTGHTSSTYDAWYEFVKDPPEGGTRFFARTDTPLVARPGVR